MKTSLFDISKYNVVSPSFLKNLAMSGSPAHALANRMSGYESSLEMQMGSAIDVAVMDPENFHKRVKVLPKIPSTSKSLQSQDHKFVKAFLCFKWIGASDNRAAHWAKKTSGHRFKIDTLLKKIEEGGEWEYKRDYILWSLGADACIDSSMEKNAWGARNAVMNYKMRPDDPSSELLGDVISESIIQPKLEWTNEATGVKCRGEADGLNPDFGGWDLKKAFDASYQGFGRKWGQMDKLKYVDQVAGYDEAFRTEWGIDVPWFIIAVEDKPPHFVSLWRVSDWDLKYGLDRFSKGCAKYQFLQENNLWSMGYDFDAYYRVTDFYEVEKKVDGGLAVYETDLYSRELLYGDS